MNYVDMIIMEDDGHRILGRFVLGEDNKIQIKATEEDRKMIDSVLEDGITAPIDLENITGPSATYIISDGKYFLERLQFGFCGSYVFCTEMKTMETK